MELHKALSFVRGYDALGGRCAVLERRVQLIRYFQKCGIKSGVFRNSRLFPRFWAIHPIFLYCRCNGDDQRDVKLSRRAMLLPLLYLGTKALCEDLLYNCKHRCLPVARVSLGPSTRESRS